MPKKPRYHFTWLAILFLTLAPLARTSHAQASNDEAQPKTKAEIQQWYKDEIGDIRALNKTWLKNGHTAEQRAEQAEQIRHDARIKVRTFMSDPAEVKALQQRDQEEFGNPDGPTLAYRVKQNQSRGLVGDAVYEDIVASDVESNAK